MDDAGERGPALEPVVASEPDAQFDPDMIKRMVRKKKAEKDKKDAARQVKKEAKKAQKTGKGFQN